MAAGEDERAADSALETEAQLVLTLGGYALELAGARLVTNEHVAVPRFNFVQELGIARERQTAFFERALDHYFQRALRPTFRVRIPVPGYLDANLRRLGFQARPEPLTLLLGEPRAEPASRATTRVRLALDDELDQVAAFWTSERERPELAAALSVAIHHPNPYERLVPVLAELSGAPVGVALVYRYRNVAGIFGVTTLPQARGRGVASDLTRWVTAENVTGPGCVYFLLADSARLEKRLASLGFQPARTFRVYELASDSALALPSPGLPGPPQWRPPRVPRKFTGSGGAGSRA
ncbi:MAG: GNAT family N-acetyltransferase [Thermoplasmata archaeon]